MPLLGHLLVIDVVGAKTNRNVLYSVRPESTSLFLPERVLVLLANLSEHKPEYYPLFLFSLRAAFRPGEIRGACGSRTLPLTVPSPWRVTSRPSPGGALAPQERRRPLADRLGSHKDLRPFSEDLGASCRSCGLRWLPAAEGGRP